MLQSHNFIPISYVLERELGHLRASRFTSTIFNLKQLKINHPQRILSETLNKHPIKNSDTGGSVF